MPSAPSPPPSARGLPPRSLSATACLLAAFSAPLLPLLSPRLPSLRPSATALRRASSSAMSAGDDAFGGGAGVAIAAPSGRADSVVVFLHGLGDTARGWAGAFPLAGLENTKYVLPTAEAARVTLNGGMRMPSWFDLYGLDEEAREDAEGIERAAARVARIVEREVAAGIARERVVVGGFSQGGAVALAAGFLGEGVGGVVAMSTWAPRAPLRGKAGWKGGDVIMCHGEADGTVPMVWGRKSAEALREKGVEVAIKTYAGMAHGACEKEMEDVKEFLQKRLAK